jgi:GNAT superfamily N-acetyltransferase
LKPEKVGLNYRPFRNGDPPALAEIWRSQPPERGLMQPMSADLFEQMLLAKPYFDNQGLIVALNDGRPVGFVHAAFGPSDDGRRLSTQLGVTCLVMVRLDYQRRGIGAELLARSEAYLRCRGAQMLYAGGIQPLNGFYLGLYGGSELPGVLDSAPRAQYLFESQGYRKIDRVRVLRRDLAGFRAPVDRQQIQIRRRMVVKSTDDPPARTWWEACTWGVLERTRFDLSSRDGEGTLATATFWSIDPLAHSWGVRASGLIELEVQESQRRQGLATFLLSEAMRQLQLQGTSLVEVQTMQHNAAALQLYHKLGFSQIDQGAVFRKEGGG